MNIQVHLQFGCFLCFLSSTVSTDTSQLPHKKFDDHDSDPWRDVPTRDIDPKETDKNFWTNRALDILNMKIHNKLNTNKAKNIIFFLGDGMSVTTLTAARIYKGQLHNASGEEQKLFLETFPYSGLSKTYCVDKQVADSASTATAYMCGVKANYQTIGVSARVQVGDCEAAKKESNKAASITQWAQQAGKSTGIVTTSRVTHASPAGCYAHVPWRDMESDFDVQNLKLDTASCNFDIAKQLVFDEPGRNINVVMGGGSAKFLPKIAGSNGNGSRLDGDLVSTWIKNKETAGKKAVYATDVYQLKAIDESATEYVLGLFAPSHISYHLENKTDQPTLEQMTEKAIKILRKNSNGFFLFVEGARIDMAHHDDEAHIALDETVEFDKAIEKAYKLTNSEDTLIVVTADHAHTMTMSGYPARGNDIIGLYGKSEDGLPYATLSYANGPGYRRESSQGKRYNLESDDMHVYNYKFPAMVPKKYETHGGDDVAVYASGPWAHLFSGNYEQNYIPIAEAYAAKIGPGKDIDHHSSNAIIHVVNYFIVLCLVLIALIIRV